MVHRRCNVRNIVREYSPIIITIMITIMNINMKHICNKRNTTFNIKTKIIITYTHVSTNITEHIGHNHMHYVKHMYSMWTFTIRIDLNNTWSNHGRRRQEVREPDPPHPSHLKHLNYHVKLQFRENLKFSGVCIHHRTVCSTCRSKLLVSKQFL